MYLMSVFPQHRDWTEILLAYFRFVTVDCH